MTTEKYDVKIKPKKPKALYNNVSVSRNAQHTYGCLLLHITVLRLGTDSVFGWLVIMHTYLYMVLVFV